MPIKFIVVCIVPFFAVSLPTLACMLIWYPTLEESPPSPSRHKNLNKSFALLLNRRLSMTGLTQVYDKGGIFKEPTYSFTSQVQSRLRRLLLLSSFCFRVIGRIQRSDGIKVRRGERSGMMYATC